MNWGDGLTVTPVTGGPMKFPEGVGSKVGQLPLFNPDAEEPPEHVYARGNMVAKKRLDNRVAEDAPINLDHVIECKQRGTDCFKKKEIEAAQSHYEDGASLLLTRIFKVDGGSFTECLEGDERHALAMELLRACYINSAMCCLKLAEQFDDTWMQHGCWARASWHATLVMASEPNNLKALYRRGVAGGELRKFPKAIHDLTTAIKLDPQSKDLRAALKRVYEKRDGDRKSEKSMFSSDKLASMVESDSPMIGHVKDPNDLSDIDPYAQASMFHAMNKKYDDNGGSTFDPKPPRKEEWWEKQKREEEEELARPLS